MMSLSIPNQDVLGLVISIIFHMDFLVMQWKAALKVHNDISGKHNPR